MGSLFDQVQPGPQVNWQQVTPDEARFCRAIAERARRFIVDYRKHHPKNLVLEPDLQIIVMDVMLTHIKRDMKLFEWLTAGDPEFLTEFAQVASHINRSLADFPQAVKLRFARKGEIASIII